jgi:hypothetical protein
MRSPTDCACPAHSCVEGDSSGRGPDKVRPLTCLMLQSGFHSFRIKVLENFTSEFKIVIYGPENSDEKLTEQLSFRHVQTADYIIICIIRWKRSATCF